MGLRSWLRRAADPTTRVAPRHSFRPVLDPLEARDVPAVVGYYDMAHFQGIDSQVASITAAGHTAVRLYDLTPADLAGLDVLVVQNLFTGAYGFEYLSRLDAVQAAVGAGLSLVIHDRYVDGAESILPGGSGFNVVRDFSDANNIQVLDDGTLLTHGPGGVVTDATLDNGSYSSHGYATAASLPADARKLLSTGDPSHVVTFSYRFGAGNVVYSSIPLDYYLGQPGSPFAQVYAPNVVAYAADLLNRPPAASPVMLYTAEDAALGGRLAASDPNGDTLTYAVATGPRHGTVTVTDPATGEFVYTPAPNYFGLDEFTFAATDARGGTATGTVTVGVTPVNDAPAAAADAVAAAEDTALVVRVLDNDTDADGDSLTVTSFTQGANGVVSVGGGGVLVYTPATDFNGTDTFTYTISDGYGGTATATVTVTVAPVNDAPVATAGELALAEDGSVSIDLLANASDEDGDALIVTVTDPAHGTVTLQGGTATYTPDADFYGTDEFTYTVDDGSGGTASATVTVTVTPINDPPTAGAGADATADEGALVAFAATATDRDGDTLTYQWDFGDGSTGTGPAATHAYLDDGVYTAVLRVTDGRGGVATDTRTVTVRNVAPVVTAGPGTTIDEGGTFAATGTFSDPGLDAGSVTVDYGDGSGVQPLVLNSDGSFALTHAYADDGVYTVTVRVDDGDGGVGTAAVTVTVRNVAPVANAGADRAANRGDTVALTGTFTDPGPADTHTRTWAVRNPAGQVVASGSGAAVSFVPAAGGVYLASFTVTDDDGGTATDTVQVTVAGSTAPLTVTGPTESQLGRTVTFTAALAVSGPSLTAWVVTDSRGRIVAATVGGHVSFLVSTPGQYTVTCLAVTRSGLYTATARLTAAAPPQLPDPEPVSRPGRGRGHRG
ncbi:Ig-like domain-containing protein [Urbifossiella limnaea]|uniref:Microbial collagenase n=1 Tax=Urbifossiella limnaea TaxID=2528023 RepID=A0A517Y162_9BACT|nr:Ig-like domain-containing protein [Urbifossiella limnaea]QDU23495.1 Microbial collagenase precursor [Urbifossiella limnaea]